MVLAALGYAAHFLAAKSNIATNVVHHSVIDCDLHNELPSLQTLYPYLAPHWVDYCNGSGFTEPDSGDYPRKSLVNSNSSVGDGNELPTSGLSVLRTQALDVFSSEIGILNCAYRVSAVHNSDLAAALSTALNQWQITEWLDREPRLRGSIVVPSKQPEAAALEIDRFGDHPSFVQVILPVRSEAPYGNHRYDPIYSAAVRHDLVVGIQYGGSTGLPSTPNGWALTYWEEYAGMAQVFQSQVMSLIVEGVFDRFPTLRVVLIEGGWTWLPSLMWRIDKEWKGLRQNTPWVSRLPSKYIHEHLRLTTQPMDLPPSERQLQQLMNQLESQEMLLFSTNYPHNRYSTLNQALPVGIDNIVLAKILAENARSFYRLKKTA